MDCTVVVATFGGDEWHELAAQRAVPSAQAQGVPVIHARDKTLARARNLGLAGVASEFVIFLDADDELEPGYVDAMADADADIRAPRVRCMRDGKEVRRGLFMPQIGIHMRDRAHQCSGECLPFGNWIVIGACARTAVVREVGGFEEWPIYEDWALWLRCWKAGATVAPVPDAIYRQHLAVDSRNHVGPAYEDRAGWHERIVTKILGEVPVAA